MVFLVESTPCAIESWLYGHLEELHKINGESLEAVRADIMEEQAARPSPTRSQCRGDHFRAGRLVDHGAGERPSSGVDGAMPGQTGTDERLTAVESSMASLTDAVLQELSLLRQALLQSSQDKDPEEK